MFTMCLESKPVDLSLRVTCSHVVIKAFESVLRFVVYYILFTICPL